MTWNYDKMINIEQIIALASRLGLLPKYPTLPYKAPKIANFRPFINCDVTWWCHNSKTKKIWNQPAKSFHMRYHTTLSDFRIKFCRFSDHYDVTMRVFPEWVTSSKVGPFLNKDPCQVLSKSLEPFLNKTDLTLKTYFFEISSCCHDVTMRAKPHGNDQYWRCTLNEQN